MPILTKREVEEYKRARDLLHVVRLQGTYQGAATMNLQEVRKAAEQITIEGLDAWYQEAIDVAAYALASIPPNPDAPVTADWLREVWGTEEEFYDGQMYYWLTVGIGDCCLNVEFSDDGCIRVYLYDAGAERIATELPHITSKHQFTQLAAALGLKPKEKA